MQGLRAKTGRFPQRFVKNIPLSRECNQCLNSYSPRHDKQKYCSKKCSELSHKKDHARDCVQCGKSFTAVSMKTRFCSHACYGKSMIREKLIKLKKERVYKRLTISCLQCSSEFLVTASRIKRVKFCSKSCQGRFFSGEKSCHYKKDRDTLVKKQERNDSAYKEWRKQVWLRDNFKCKIANPDCSGRIEAHHILGWSSHPELRYQVNNGITLCHAHHPRKRGDELKLSPYFQYLVASVD